MADVDRMDPSDPTRLSMVLDLIAKAAEEDTPEARAKNLADQRERFTKLNASQTWVRTRRIWSLRLYCVTCGFAVSIRTGRPPSEDQPRMRVAHAKGEHKLQEQAADGYWWPFRWETHED